MNESHNREIDVRVLFFGSAREVVGATSLVLSLKAPAKLADATNALFERYQALNDSGARCCLP
jgi:molybdopterin converting factor small subunit